MTVRRRSAAPTVRRVRQLLEGYSGQVGSLRLRVRGLDPRIVSALSIEERDVSTPQSQAASLLSVAPYFIIFGALCRRDVPGDRLHRRRTGARIFGTPPDQPGEAILSRARKDDRHSAVYRPGGSGDVGRLCRRAQPRPGRRVRGSPDESGPPGGAGNLSHQSAHDAAGGLPCSCSSPARREASKRRRTTLRC